MVLSFERSKAGGVLFEVQRQLQPIGQQPGAWDTLATIGQKEHVDTAVGTAPARRLSYARPQHPSHPPLTSTPHIHPTSPASQIGFESAPGPNA